MKKEVFNSTVIRLLSVTLIALNLAGCTAEWEQPGGFYFAGLAERFKAAALKTDKVKAFGGSNPPSGAN